MSTSRVWTERPGYPRDAEGRPLCRWCREPVPKGRRTFCGEACVREWDIRTSPSYARQLVFNRDRGVCALCGLNCGVLERVRPYGWAKDRMTQREWSALLTAMGFPLDCCHNRSLWDADHIVPVVEGGGACGLDNYMTLCVPCHRQKTAQLAAKRAAQRRVEVEPAPLPQLPLFEAVL